MSAPRPIAGPYSSIQHIQARAGFAYGVIGADLHVFGDGPPLYLLENYAEVPSRDPKWLRETPSRMLNPHYAVVDFVGRETELAKLHEWRVDNLRMAARWLHAPGGQGKTRLAAQLARESAAAGWKVVRVTHGAGALSSVHDLSIGDSDGLLVLIDYADRWPMGHLVWLFSNALLHQETKTRILLLARNTFLWPAIRSNLERYRAVSSQQLLERLPAQSDEREVMFITARDRFAALYGIADVSSIPLPRYLEAWDFGLTLTIHMAALVAVDAYACGRPNPKGIVDLSAYLLDREWMHWEKLYSGHASGLDYATPPSVMNRVALAATLTGPVDYADGRAILNELDLEVHAERALSDHALCYPSVDAVRPQVLVPLYPDRLGEDFLALSIPGHTTDHPTSVWAVDMITRLLARRGDKKPPFYVDRAITFLAAAAQRSPHVYEMCLRSLLMRDPQLAVDAGSSGLTALAGIPEIDVDVLEAIERLLPRGSDAELAPGSAAIVERLFPHQLLRAHSPVEQAFLYEVLGIRLSWAGRHQSAVEVTQKALEILRGMRGESNTAELQLARTLTNVGMMLSKLGRREAALTYAEEAANIFRGLAEMDPIHLPALALALYNLSLDLSRIGRKAESIAVAEEAVEIFRKLATNHADAITPETYWQALIEGPNMFTQLFAKIGHTERAAVVAVEAVRAYRVMADDLPGTYTPALVTALTRLGEILFDLDDVEGAVGKLSEGVELARRLASAVPAEYDVYLTNALNGLIAALSRQGRAEESLKHQNELVEVYRRLVRTRSEYVPELACRLNNVGASLAKLRRYESALPPLEEAVTIYQRLADVDVNKYGQTLSGTLENVEAVRFNLAQARLHEENLARVIEETKVHGADLFSDDTALGSLAFRISLDRNITFGGPLEIKGSEPQAVPVLMLQTPQAAIGRIADRTVELQLLAIISAGLPQWEAGLRELRLVPGWHAQRAREGVELRDGQGGLWAYAEMTLSERWLAAAASFGCVFAVYGPQLGVRTPNSMNQSEYTASLKADVLVYAQRHGFVAAAFVEWRA